MSMKLDNLNLTNECKRDVFGSLTTIHFNMQLFDIVNGDTTQILQKLI